MTTWFYESDGEQGNRTHYAVRDNPDAPCGVERRDFKTAAQARRFVADANTRCPECEAYDRIHDQRCKRHPDHDWAPKE